jgi:hypothetical protein
MKELKDGGMEQREGKMEQRSLKEGKKRKLRRMRMRMKKW